MMAVRGRGPGELHSPSCYPATGGHPESASAELRAYIDAENDSRAVTRTVRWADVTFETGRMTVPCPKTEGVPGKEYRVCPIFAALRPYLDEAFELAAEGAEYVVSGATADKMWLGRSAAQKPARPGADVKRPGRTEPHRRLEFQAFGAVLSAPVPSGRDELVTLRGFEPRSPP